MKRITLALAALLAAGTAQAGDGQPWWSGDWYVSLGAAGYMAPEFEGSADWSFQWTPIVSVSKGNTPLKFSSRNDSPSLGLIDTGALRAGLSARYVRARDSADNADLAGLDDVRWGAELGGFVEVYPSDWLRVRAELRRGIRAHEGVVADVSVDAFTDLAPDLRLSGGPRASFASKDYFDTYYGVTAAESAASGLSTYTPGDGMKSFGVGTALTWTATENISTTAFAEYNRLAGPAADSSLVRERGSANQVTVGLSAVYKFGFTVP